LDSTVSLSRQITERPIKENKQFIVTRRRKTSTPPADHPWRRFNIKNYHYDRKRFLESQI